MGQILLNLLSNAVKFTAAGHVELRIGYRTHEDKRIELTIEVEDTGIGLRPNDIRQLFKPFSQSDASITRRFGGTGLGLAICKQLAEMMGGEIGVSSIEGKGSTFRVRLTLAPGDPEKLPLATDELIEDTPQIYYRDARVMVVDDQAFNRDVIEGLLGVVGIAPYLAANGQEALDILTTAETGFDLVLMDVQMPVMDGLTATRAIREREALAQLPTPLPIVAMTAHTMTHEREKCADAGMNDHLGKPFDEAEFYGLLAKWIPSSKRQSVIAASPVPAPPQSSDAPFQPLPGIDTHAGLNMLLGDTARYRHWLVDFATEAPTMLAQMKSDLAAGNAQSAGMVAHNLKGRMGLLGVKDAYAIAAAIEEAIDGARPLDELLSQLDRQLTAVCHTIRDELDSAEASTSTMAATTATASDALPPHHLPELRPEILAYLIERLHAGDSDCEAIVETCLAELEDTAWAPFLRQALDSVKKFDYAAAWKLLSGS